jgi:hypothetical protein
MGARETSFCRTRNFRLSRRPISTACILFRLRKQIGEGSNKKRSACSGAYFVSFKEDRVNDELSCEHATWAFFLTFDESRAGKLQQE